MITCTLYYFLSSDRRPRLKDFTAESVRDAKARALTMLKRSARQWKRGTTLGTCFFSVHELDEGYWLSSKFWQRTKLL